MRDRYSEVAASQQMATAVLAADDAPQARRMARAGFERWTDTGFHIQHFWSLRQQAQCDLYEAKAGEALHALEHAWKALRRSGLLRIALPRVDAHDLRGRLAVAAIAERPARRAALIRVARQCANRLRHEVHDHAHVRAGILEAALRNAGGEPAQAIAQLEQAAILARQLSMRQHEAVADYRRGQLMGNDEGAALVAKATDAMRSMGVVRVERWADVYAPGFQE